MKTKLSKRSFTLLFLPTVMLAASLAALKLSQPQRVGLPLNSVTMKEVLLPNGKGFFLDAHRMNYLGQIQGVAVRLNVEKKQFLIDRYVVRWHPLSRFTTHSDFPVVIETKDLSPGKYEVLAWNRSEGYTSVGTFSVPIK